MEFGPKLSRKTLVTIMTELEGMTEPELNTSARTF